MMTYLLFIYFLKKQTERLERVISSLRLPAATNFSINYSIQRSISTLRDAVFLPLKIERRKMVISGNHMSPLLILTTI